eukprot:gene26645-32196_t
MGANNSVLTSLDSLNNSLESIERKLFDVSSIQLHHSDSVIQNDDVLVRGKRIRCNPAVNCVVGPLLGLISTNSCRVMLEIDRDSDISLHIFKNSKHFMSEMFVRSVIFKVKGHAPYICHIDGLETETAYDVYIGGLNQNQTLNNVLSFSTWNKELKSVNLQVIGDAFSSGNLNGRDISRDFTSPSASTNDQAQALFVQGDYNPFDNDITERIMRIMEFGCSPVSSAKDLLVLLAQLETKLQNNYRKLLKYNVIANVAKQVTSVFMTAASKAVIEYLHKVYSTYIAVTARSPATKNDNSEDNEDNDANAIQDSEVSLFGNDVAKTKQKYNADSTQLTSQLRDLRSVALSAIARIFRRFDLLYFRQLWDVQANAYIEDDLKRESLMREILVVTKEAARLSTASSDKAKAKEDLGKQLEKLAQEAGELNLTMRSPPNITLLESSPLALIVVESAWNCLGSDGLLDFSHLQTPLEDAVLSQLSADLLETAVYKDVQFLLTFSTVPLSGLPHSSGLWSQCGLSTADSSKILELLAFWQQLQDHRAVFLSAPSYEGYSLRRSLSPRILATDETTDKWKADRATLLEVLMESDEDPYRPHLRALVNSSDEVEEEEEQQAVLTFDPTDVVRFEEGVKSWSIIYSTYSPKVGTSPNCKLTVEPKSEQHSENLTAFRAIIGKVSQSSAIVVVERTSENEPICLRCVDCITGMEVYCSRLLDSSVFLSSFRIDALLANRHYLLLCDRQPNNSISSFNYSATARVTTVVGSFTTMKDQSVAMLENEEVVSTDPFRLFVVGRGTGDGKSFNDFTRELHLQWEEVCQCLTQVLSSPWNGVDIVVHLGSSVDWVQLLRDTAPLLKTMENEVALHGSLSTNLSKVEKCVAEAFQSSFGLDSARSMLAHGCHLFLADPVRELLSHHMAHVSRGDLTGYGQKLLCELVQKHYNLYRQAMWPEMMRVNSSCSLLYCLGGVCVVHLFRNLMQPLEPLDFKSVLPSNAKSLVLLLSCPILGAGITSWPLTDHELLHEEQIILDACADWALCNPATAREVLLLASGGQGETASEISLIRRGKQGDEILCSIKQLSVGSLLAPSPLGFAAESRVTSYRIGCAYECRHAILKEKDPLVSVSMVEIGSMSPNIALTSVNIDQMRDLKEENVNREVRDFVRLQNSTALSLMRLVDGALGDGTYVGELDENFPALMSKVTELSKAFDVIFTVEIKESILDVVRKWDSGDCGVSVALLSPVQYYLLLFMACIQAVPASYKRYLRQPSSLAIRACWSVMHRNLPSSERVVKVVQSQEAKVLEFFLMAQLWQLALSYLCEEQINS